MKYFRIFITFVAIIGIIIYYSPAKGDDLDSGKYETHSSVIIDESNVCSQDDTLSRVNLDLLMLNTDYYRINPNVSDLCDIKWKVTLIGSLGTDTSVTVECESGGKLDCPLLPHCIIDEMDLE